MGFGGLGAVVGSLIQALGSLLGPAPAMQKVAKRPSPVRPTPASARKGETLLVLGTDATSEGGRSGFRGNTDTMMLVHVVPGGTDPQHPGAELAVFSVPRDTRVPIPGHDRFKINAANAYGGPKLAMETVSAYLDVPIDHYLLLNLHGLMAAVDAVGGVDVTIPKPLNYDDYHGDLHIHFRPGLQHMDGHELEAYVRFRHDDDADIGRIGRQQALIRQVADQILSPRNFFRLPQLWGILQSNMQTDLSLGQVVSLAEFLKGLNRDQDVRMTMLPGEPRYIGGVSYWMGDRDAAAPFLDRYFRPGEATASVPVAEGRTVTLWDGVAVSDRLLHRVEAELSAAGFEVDHVGPVADDLPHLTTRVIAERGDAKGAARLAQVLGTGHVVVTADGDFRTDFTVVLGRDLVSPGHGG